MKIDLLRRHGVEFDKTPAWQRYGCGLHWEEYEKPAANPKTGEAVLATRRRLTRILELPHKEAFSEFLWKLLATTTPA